MIASDLFVWKIHKLHIIKFQKQTGEVMMQSSGHQQNDALIYCRCLLNLCGAKGEINCKYQLWSINDQISLCFCSITSYDP